MILCGLLGAMGAVAWAATPKPWASLEERAQHEARLFNEHSASLIEGPTLAVQAVAQGRQVVYTHTVRRDAAFAPESIEAFKVEYDTVVRGIVCSGLARDADFKAGLAYLTIFQDPQGQRLHILRLDRAVCDRL